MASLTASSDILPPPEGPPGGLRCVAVTTRPPTRLPPKVALPLHRLPGRGGGSASRSCTFIESPPQRPGE
eukprot:1893850-Lingulodinium_polyedra.AAC.1